MLEGIQRNSFRSKTSFDLFGPARPESGKTAEETAALNWRSDTNGLGRAGGEPREGRTIEALAILEAEGRRLPCNLRD